MRDGITILESDAVFAKCQCDRCGEIFRREVSHIHSRHMCKESIDSYEHLEYDEVYHPIRTEYKKIHEDAILPTKSYVGDAGIDVYAVETVELPPGEITNVDTGISLALPQGYYMAVEGRSSLYKKNIFPARGIIDANYIGPCIVAIVNHSKLPHVFNKGDRIAQLVAHRCIPMDMIEVKKFSESYSDRGTNGFGSSGK